MLNQVIDDLMNEQTILKSSGRISLSASLNR